MITDYTQMYILWVNTELMNVQACCIAVFLKFPWVRGYSDWNVKLIGRLKLKQISRQYGEWSKLPSPTGHFNVTVSDPRAILSLLLILLDSKHKLYYSFVITFLCFLIPLGQNGTLNIS
jgi:hypothetical protein